MSFDIRRMPADSFFHQEVPYVDSTGLLSFLRESSFQSHLLLVGPTGLAKTLSVYAWAQEQGYPVVEFSCSEEVRETHLIGSFGMWLLAATWLLNDVSFLPCWSKHILYVISPIMATLPFILRTRGFDVRLRTRHHRLRDYTAYGSSGTGGTGNSTALRSPRSQCPRRAPETLGDSESEVGGPFCSQPMTEVGGVLESFSCTASPVSLEKFAIEGKFEGRRIVTISKVQDII